MFSEEAMKLTKPVVQAIKKIAERQECLMCQGKGYIVTGPALPDQYNCPNCKGTGKLKWKWEPGVGEWCIYNPDPKQVTKDFIGLVGLVYAVDKDGYICVMAENREFSDKHSEFIPLLHWERIEKILEGMGEELEINRAYPRGDKRIKWIAGIHIIKKLEGITNKGGNALGGAKTRQEAVMRSVIALAKEE